MRVNTSTPLNAAAEPASASGKTAATGSASFFEQIGQIWNEEGGNAPAEESAGKGPQTAAVETGQISSVSANPQTAAFSLPSFSDAGLTALGDVDDTGMPLSAETQSDMPEGAAPAPVSAGSGSENLLDLSLVPNAVPTGTPTGLNAHNKEEKLKDSSRAADRIPGRKTKADLPESAQLPVEDGKSLGEPALAAAVNGQQAGRAFGSAEWTCEAVCEPEEGTTSSNSVLDLTREDGSDEQAASGTPVPVEMECDVDSIFSHSSKRVSAGSCEGEMVDAAAESIPAAGLDLFGLAFGNTEGSQRQTGAAPMSQPSDQPTAEAAPIFVDVSNGSRSLNGKTVAEKRETGVKTSPGNSEAESVGQNVSGNRPFVKEMALSAVAQQDSNAVSPANPEVRGTRTYGSSEQKTGSNNTESAAAAATQNINEARPAIVSENSSASFASIAINSNGSTDSRAESVKPNAPAAKLQSETAASYVLESGRIAEPAAISAAKSPEILETRSRDFLFELAERISVQLRDGNDSIRIQLKPDSLGQLEIRAESTVDGVVARIVAESDRVKNYLETNLHLLQQTLQDQGLKVEQIQVSVQDGYNSPSYSGSAQSGHAGSRQEQRENAELSGRAILDEAEDPSVDSATWTTPTNLNGRFHRIA